MPRRARKARAHLLPSAGVVNLDSVIVSGWPIILRRPFFTPAVKKVARSSGQSALRHEIRTLTRSIIADFLQNGKERVNRRETAKGRALGSDRTVLRLDWNRLAAHFPSALPFAVRCSFSDPVTFGSKQDVVAISFSAPAQQP